MRQPARAVLASERGSVLMIAVIAMLILGVLGISFALLGTIESSIGINYKAQAQAEATAEAGLDWARDQIRSAGGATVGTGFTPWFDGTKATYMLTSGSGQSVGAFTFKVRIDNDCLSTVISQAARESSTCTNSTDTNETAVLTSWATVGSAQARVRALVYVDNPWKHVCADSQNDPGGQYCNSAGNTKGNPTVLPSDPGDPNGPRGYSTLPLPIIGCSRIDPTVHRMTTVTCAAAAASVGGTSQLFVQPGITNYPNYPANATYKQLVLMGEDKALTATAKTCGQDYQSPSKYYFGYFDCALRTPCPASVCGTVRKGCIRGDKDPDTGAAANTANYFRLNTAVVYDGTACGANTGMVFLGSTDFTSDVGTSSQAYTVYVMHDSATPDTTNIPTATDHAPGHTIYGTLVVEGNLSFLTKSVICTGGPPPSNPPASYTSTCGTPTGTAYSYPMAVLSYDPKLPYPTVSPQAPQPTLTNFGAASGATINGQVYSGGAVSFNPVNVNGSTVAFNIDLQSTASTYAYVPDYGVASPPSGFPPGSSDPVVLMPKSFVVCQTYNDDTTAATTCQ